MYEHEQRRRHKREPGAESHEALARDGPRIHVASLSDYNNGILHGRWIDAVADPEAMQNEIDEMLAASPMTALYGDVAEEWAVHDYDGFGAIRLGEHESLDFVARLAGGIEMHGQAFAAYAAHVGEYGLDLVTQFEAHYLGEWESVEAYAENMLDELGAKRVRSDAPEWLQPYLSVDVAGFARDLEVGGDVVVVERLGGGVWVFTL
jgi:antirestriction protein